MLRFFRRSASAEQDQLVQKLLREVDELKDADREKDRVVEQHKRVLVGLQTERDDAIRLASAWKKKAEGGAASDVSFVRESVLMGKSVAKE